MRGLWFRLGRDGQTALRVLFVGGGTGGHIYPALTVAERLKERYPDCRLLYVGTKEGLEADLVPRRGLPFRTIAAQGLFGKSPLAAARGLLKAVGGSVQALSLVRGFRPDVVVGTGGYVSGPVMMVAALLRRPTLLMEANVFPGMTVRALSRWVSVVTVPYPAARRYFRKGVRVEVVNNPVRQEILAASREAGAAALGLSPNKPTLLLFGGSRGALTLNRAGLDLVRLFSGRPDWQLIWGTGKTYFPEITKKLADMGFSELPPNVRVEPFLYRVENALAASDLIVCRAGGSTLAEVTVRGLPAIIVPSPVATHHHQDYNARAVAEGGAALVVADAEAGGGRIVREVAALLGDRKRLEAMAARSRALGQPAAADRLVDLIVSLAAGESAPHHAVPRGVHPKSRKGWK